MPSFNRVVVLGHVTRNIELKHVGNGTALCEVGLAINERHKNAKGEWIEDVVFVDVTLWGRTAEIAAEHLNKGDAAFIEGRLKLDTWEKDGRRRQKLKVVGERLQLLGGKGGGGGNGKPRRDAYSEPEPAEREPAHACANEQTPF